MIFQHHPGGLIYVRGTDKTYCDTMENFAIDLGSSYPGLPDEYIRRIYDQGKRHVISDGSNDVKQDFPWIAGNSYVVAARDFLFEKQAARKTEVEV